MITAAGELSDADFEESIRGFLAHIDPETDYLEQTGDEPGRRRTVAKTDGDQREVATWAC